MVNDFLFAQERRFWFNGQCSADFGIMASGPCTYDAPEWDVEKISIPGRHGDMILRNGRLKNLPIQYPVSIARNFPEHALAAKAWLLSDHGYHRLTDSYNPEYFRLASFLGPIDFDVKFLNRAGEAELSFDCKPQFFLKSGETPLAIASNGTMLRNPCAFPAQPLVTVYGAGDGSLTVGGVTVEFFGLDGEISLDCEDMEAYRLVAGVMVGRNKNISAPEFPVLQPGPNEVTWAGGVERVEIIPRWWTL